MHLVISGGVWWFFSPFLKMETGASYFRREDYGFPSSALGLLFKEYGFMLRALDFTMQEIDFTSGELGFTMRELDFTSQ